VGAISSSIFIILGFPDVAPTEGSCIRVPSLHPSVLHCTSHILVVLSVVKTHLTTRLLIVYFEPQEALILNLCQGGSVMIIGRVLATIVVIVLSVALFSDTIPLVKVLYHSTNIAERRFVRVVEKGKKCFTGRGAEMIAKEIERRALTEIPIWNLSRICLDSPETEQGTTGNLVIELGSGWWGTLSITPKQYKIFLKVGVHAGSI
jgi:hypothetical protein